MKTNPKRIVEELKGTTAVLCCVLCMAGCKGPAKQLDGLGILKYQDEGERGIVAALSYPDNPVVRSEAVEAVSIHKSESLLELVRLRLGDSSPGVRFSACMVLGEARDRDSQSVIRTLLDDPDPSVRASAVFALHRIGDTSRTAELTTMLLAHEEPLVRANAAIILGRLGEPSAVRPLAKAMRDEDQAVRFHALESMALLGVREAIEDLILRSQMGAGSEEAFAIQALGRLKDPVHKDLFRSRLQSGSHLETRLAAARALADLGDASGLELARKSLGRVAIRMNDPEDSPQNQRLRIRTLAVSTLGATRRAELLPLLKDLMLKDEDPRVQVAAARSILELSRAASADLSDAVFVTTNGGP